MVIDKPCFKSIDSKHQHSSIGLTYFHVKNIEIRESTMKVKVLSRNPDDYLRETKRDIQKGKPYPLQIIFWHWTYYPSVSIEIISKGTLEINKK